MTATRTAAAATRRARLHTRYARTAVGLGALGLALAASPTPLTAGFCALGIAALIICLTTQRASAPTITSAAVVLELAVPTHPNLILVESVIVLLAAYLALTADPGTAMLPLRALLAREGAAFAAATILGSTALIATRITRGSATTADILTGLGVAASVGILVLAAAVADSTARPRHTATDRQARRH